VRESRNRTLLRRIDRADFLALGGTFRIEQVNAPLLLALLPSIIHIPVSEGRTGRLHRMIELIADECRNDEPGKEMLLQLAVISLLPVAPLILTVIPLGELPRRLGELDPSAEIVVHCKSGGRSARAAALLQERGFTRVFNLTGGILRWINEIDSSLPRY